MFKPGKLQFAELYTHATNKHFKLKMKAQKSVKNGDKKQKSTRMQHT